MARHVTALYAAAPADEPSRAARPVAGMVRRCLAVLQVVQNEPVRYPADVPISDNLRDLLDRMLTKVRQPAARSARCLHRHTGCALHTQAAVRHRAGHTPSRARPSQHDPSLRRQSSSRLADSLPRSHAAACAPCARASPLAPQNPRERITMQEVMRHPWVTVGNTAPLKPYRELRQGETQESHAGVAPGSSFADGVPKPDFLRALANISRHEQVGRAGRRS